MREIDLLGTLYTPCPRGCGRTMDGCYEAEDGDKCAGSPLVRKLEAELAMKTEALHRLHERFIGSWPALLTITEKALRNVIVRDGIAFCGVCGTLAESEPCPEHGHTGRAWCCDRCAEVVAR